MSKPIELIIAGAGQRGWEYSRFALEFPERLKIVGVAEPREFYRDRMSSEHSIPSENVFSDWREMAGRSKFADGVIIATQDRDHVDPAIAFADLGYNILLEKPMAPSADECVKIVDAVKKSGNIFAVCHVLRYTSYTKKLKSILDAGDIGDVVSIQHVEPVGYWHMAHSFVRGNWRSEKESSSMLLAKSCHDLDYIRHLMDCKCTAVSSFGSLKHFRKSEKPDGASDRCLDCEIESTCPYSAVKIYIKQADKGYFGWPVDVLTSDLTVEGVTEAVRTGPCGQCVYECDNDLVDNQVVSMEFEENRTASFTMTAFTAFARRRTSIYGTHGEIYGDGRHIKVTDFSTDETTEYDTDLQAAGPLQGHGGGDFGVMDAFVSALAENDPSLILSGPDETLESHLMVFTAEKSRKERRIINL